MHAQGQQRTLTPLRLLFRLAVLRRLLRLSEDFFDADRSMPAMPAPALFAVSFHLVRVDTELVTESSY